MTKQNLNSKQKNTKAKKAAKRLKYKFIRKTLKNKKKSLKTLTTNDTHNYKDIIKNKDKLNININFELIKKNNYKYSEKLANIHYDLYSKNILNDILQKESDINRKIITEKILNKYDLTKEHRKIAIKYLYNFMKYHNINVRSYFSSISLFDIFLINYSEDESNEENCKILFKSKATNTISETKIILFLLCCYYIVSKYFDTKRITVKQILQLENAKSETDYKDLIYLIEDIMIHSDLNMDFANIYNFIEIYMINIMKGIKELTNNQRFIESFEYYIFYFSTRIIQDIDVLKIYDSIQALGIILFSFEYSKFSSGENSEKLNSYIIKWRENFKNLSKNYNVNGLQSIINRLNIYVSK